MSHPLPIFDSLHANSIDLEYGILSADTFEVAAAEVLDANDLGYKMANDLYNEDNSPPSSDQYDSNVDSPFDDDLSYSGVPSASVSTSPKPQPRKDLQPWFTLPSYKYKPKKMKPVEEEKLESGEPLIKICKSYNLDTKMAPYLATKFSPSFFSFLHEARDPQHDCSQPIKKQKVEIFKPADHFAVDTITAADFDAQRVNDRRSRATLDSILPIQMFFQICAFLSMSDLGSLAQANLFFNSIVEEYLAKAECSQWNSIIQPTSSKWYNKQREREDSVNDIDLMKSIKSTVQTKDWRTKLRIADLKNELIKRGMEADKLPKRKALLQDLYAASVEDECKKLLDLQKRVARNEVNAFSCQLPYASCTYPRIRNDFVIRVVWNKDLTFTSDRWVKFYSSFKDAVRSALSGDIVLIYPGTIIVDEKITIKKNIEIIGNGLRDSIRIKGGGNIYIEEAHVRIFNVTIDRATETIHCTNGIVELDYCNLKSQGNCLFVGPKGNALIKNCSVQCSGKPAIVVDWHSEAVFLCNNTMTSMTLTANRSEPLLNFGTFAMVQIESLGDSLDNSSIFLKARRNTISDTPGHGIGIKSRCGFQFTDLVFFAHHHIHLQSNTFTNNIGCRYGQCCTGAPCQVTNLSVELGTRIPEMVLEQMEHATPKLCDHGLPWHTLLENINAKLSGCSSYGNKCIMGYMKRKLIFPNGNFVDHVWGDCEPIRCKVCCHPMKLLNLRESMILLGSAEVEHLFGSAADVFLCESGHIFNVSASECNIC